MFLINFDTFKFIQGFPGGTVVKNLPAKVGDSLEDPLV